MFQDSRPPVSSEMVGRFRVTIFDQAKYEQSKIDYPDTSSDKLTSGNDNVKPQFIKKKPAARWNWTKKLEQPLGGVR